MSQIEMQAGPDGAANNTEGMKKSIVKESDKAAQLYTYSVVPQFYKGAVSKEQNERPTNKRKSTRYTWPTFFPIAFGLQFKKLVNIFYLITGILNFFKTIRVNSPIAVLVPTCLIMLLGVFKEFVGELKRWKEDKKVNATPVKRMALPDHPIHANNPSGELRWEVITLADIQVGDILKIEDLEQVPADCVLLKVEDNKPECFVKTAALDGERNLKPKLANPVFSANFDEIFSTKASQETVNLSVKCIAPVKELYYFEGRVKASLPNDPNFMMNLDLNQFLHRGSYIENSGSIYAMVVYTGVESKLILNLGKYVFKMSSFEKILNRIMILNLLLAIVIAIATSIVYGVFVTAHEDATYLFQGNDRAGEFFIAFFRAYLIVNSFVPLDLLAMLEISKLMFTPIMERDTEMMVVDPTLREAVGFKANTLNLAEELAQVEYIFCDKTGTLTQNELVFRAMTLQKGQELTFDNNDAVKSMTKAVDQLNLPADQAETFANFFRCVNLCHDCISLKDLREGKKEGDVVYNGPSVDEVCLLDMARDTSISTFVNRDSDMVRIVVNGQPEEYTIIKMFPFTSERKAMSMVLQHPTEQKAICYVKGADSSVFPMCDNWGGVGKDMGAAEGHPNDKILQVERTVETMACKGLRTLLYGMKTIEWDGTRDPLDLPVEEIECNLNLLAATGVEDLLQENVKECIEDFRAAGISVWMLTGDKGLTAKEIGVSCGLIPPAKPENTEILNTVGHNHVMTEQNVHEGHDRNQTTAGQKVMMFEDDDNEATKLYEKIKQFVNEVAEVRDYQVLISGMVVAVALDNEFMHPELGNLLKRAQSVIVYRSSPGQKAQVVTFMKKYTNGKVTLAIGDGANDVNMIQSADLGFGLMGKEGNQAAAFADYAIPRYMDLRRALFWHGRGYGWRIQYFTIMVLIKSIINATAKYGVQFTNGASGLQPVDDLLITGFNILMTNWFVLHYSVYDQEVSFKDYGTLEKEKLLPYTMAELYAFTRGFINRRRFLKLIAVVDVYSILSGVFIWFVWDRCEANGIVNADGQSFGLYSYGVYMTMSVVIAHHFQVIINTRNWAWYLTGWAIFSICMLPLTLWLAQIVTKSNTYKGTYTVILRNPAIWLMVAVSAFVIVLPLYVNKRWI